ncbi:MAG: carboxypeptidase regulatory-like domain-containing protein [Gemmatimonadota bacterium]
MALCARDLSAQVVRGTIVDATTGGPIGAVLVVLVDNDGRDRGRYLADSRGAFLLKAPAPGRYAPWLELLGLETHVQQGIRLLGGDTVTLRVPMQVRPIVMDGLEVTADQRCALPREGGAALQRVWEEVRKALSLAAYTDSIAPYRYELVKSRRDLDPATLAVRQEVSTTRSVTVQQPITSRPAKVLADSGYVIQDQGSDTYLAPDAAALLSDEFLAGHCFTLRTGFGDHQGLLGLEFRPLRHISGITDIEGVLWLDRREVLLKWLDYTYVNLPGGLSQLRTSNVGGRIEFTRLPEGTVIVSNWRIRMPVALEYQEPVIRQRRVRLVAIAEEGGRVAEAWRRSTDAVAFSEVSGMIAGTVNRVEAVSRRGGGDTILVIGLGRKVPVDTAGRFRVGGLAEGRYHLAYVRPELMGLDVAYGVADVEISAGDSVDTEIEPPSRDAVFAAACSMPEWKNDTAVVLGSVVESATGAALSQVEVVSRWQRFRGIDITSGRVDGSEVSVATTTSADGGFRLCGVPMNHYVIVAARIGTSQTWPVEVRLTSAEPVARVLIRLAR